MSTLSPQPMNLDPVHQAERIEFGQQLRSQTIATRLHTAKLGTSKALTREQKEQAAQPFHADVRALSMKKRLIDTRHPAYREVSSILRRAKGYWKSITVPYPEPGTRLLRRDRVADFNAQMDRYRTSLAEAAEQLEERYSELREIARRQLGDLYNGTDYPTYIHDEFEIAWDYPNIEPPAYLRQVHPDLYEAERRRINARFEEAVSLTEQAFLAEFQKMVALLAERLNGQEDGKPKIFRDTAVTNLRGFFDQFKQLNLGSSAELDALVEQAQQVVGGVEPQNLRDDTALRANVGEQMEAIRRQLDTMMVARPSRRIYRDDEEPAPGSGAPGTAGGGGSAGDESGGGDA